MVPCSLFPVFGVLFLVYVVAPSWPLVNLSAAEHYSLDQLGFGDISAPFFSPFGIIILVRSPDVA